MRLLGRRIAIPEQRELDRLATMLEAEGAGVVRFGFMAIVDALDPTPIAGWLSALAADHFDDVIFLSGEGVARLLEAAERAGLKPAVVSALARVRNISRGPKPARVLRELGLPVDIAAIPATLGGVMGSLRSRVLTGRRIGLQLFGDDPGRELVAFLETKGAEVHPVAPYRYVPTADDGRVAAVIDEIARNGFDAIAFTTSMQVERLFEIALRRGLVDGLCAGLARLHVAALGAPVVTCLRRFNVRVDSGPTRQFFMRRLTEDMVARLGAAPVRSSRDRVTKN
jgi:uroporphyrinogen-III synthase